MDESSIIEWMNFGWIDEWMLDGWRILVGWLDGVEYMNVGYMHAENMFVLCTMIITTTSAITTTTSTTTNAAITTKVSE